MDDMDFENYYEMVQIERYYDEIDKIIDSMDKPDEDEEENKK